uniref:Uncharacterized protein n=1 Tax=Anguilla anguilla TaxID=7936 RepID=A0A0E9W469_ANGAN
MGQQQNMAVDTERQYRRTIHAVFVTCCGLK